MGTMVNPFTADGFSLMEMTAAINNVPDAARYIGRMEQLGLFRPVPIATTTFGVEEYNGVLNLLVSQPRGGPALLNKSGKRKVRDFRVPHYPLDDVLLPDEFQNVRAFGSATQLETQAGVMARKLAEMRRKHELTKEWLRMGALNGIVLDGDATTLYNFYTEFAITQKIIDFDLDDATTDVNGKCREVIFHMEDNLLGDMMTGVHCFCSRTFYNAFVAHAKVQEAYKYFLTTQQLSGNFAKKFEFGGIVFEPYGASTTDPNGVARAFVEANYAYAFPLGTNDTFDEVIAPADFIETVNTPGLPFYAKQEARKHNRGVDIHTQQNVLPICKKPGVLVKLGMNIN